MSHTGFRLLPTSMTLNDVERRNSPFQGRKRKRISVGLYTQNGRFSSKIALRFDQK